MLKRKHAAIEDEDDVPSDGGRFPLDRLPAEVTHHILSFLSLEKVLRFQLVCRRLRAVAESYIGRLTTVRLDIRFCELPTSVDDDNLATFLGRCRSAREVTGIDSTRITRRRRRGQRRYAENAEGEGDDRHPISAAGIVAALSSCPLLRGVSTGNVFVLDALLNELPHVEILKDFVNFEFVNAESDLLPVPRESILRIPPLARVSNLQLTRVMLPRLPKLPTLEVLTLSTVHFSDRRPFEGFSARKLEKFGMRNCANVSQAAALDLVRSLGDSRGLKYLELVRVPFPTGAFHRLSRELPLCAVLEELTIAACCNCTYHDVLDLVLPCTLTLKKVSLQASVCVDNLFDALKALPAPHLASLVLGYRDPFSSSPSIQALGNAALSAHGLAPFVEQSTPLTDTGHNVALQTAPALEHLTIENAPVLRHPFAWPAGRLLRRLRLTRCGNVLTSCLSEIVADLPSLRHLELTAVGYSAVLAAIGGDDSNVSAETTLSLHSSSLVTLKLDYCLYHQLVLDHCPKLNYVMVTRCSDLSSLSLEGCHVHTYDFDDCPLLPLSTVLTALKEACKPLRNNTIVMYSQPETAPKGIARRELAEEIAFRCFPTVSVAVLWHEWPAHKETHQLCGVFASMWADRISKINASLLKSGRLRRYRHRLSARKAMGGRWNQPSKPSEGELALPSPHRQQLVKSLRETLRRPIYVLQRTRNGKHSELLADLPWLRALLGKSPAAVRDFGCCALPRLLPAETKDDLRRLESTVARMQRANYKLREHVLFVVATT